MGNPTVQEYGCHTGGEGKIVGWNRAVSRRDRKSRGPAGEIAQVQRENRKQLQYPEGRDGKVGAAQTKQRVSHQPGKSDRNNHRERNADKIAAGPGDSDSV